MPRNGSGTTSVGIVRRGREGQQGERQRRRCVHGSRSNL